MDEEDVIETEHDLQHEKLLTFRRENLEKAGYDEHAVDLLAERFDIDYRLAVRIREQGCPIETALAILL